MTKSEATVAARAFIARSSNRVWSMRDIDAVMPRGWEIPLGVGTGDFYPITIGNVARQIRDNAVTARHDV